MLKIPRFAPYACRLCLARAEGPTNWDCLTAITPMPIRCSGKSRASICAIGLAIPGAFDWSREMDGVSGAPLAGRTWRG